MASWTWFYPFHYAPFASDLTRLAEVDLAFEPGEPFKPFNQLMGVLPAASRHCLPKAYQVFLRSPDQAPGRGATFPAGQPGYLQWLWVSILDSASPRMTGTCRDPCRHASILLVGMFVSSNTADLYGLDWPSCMHAGLCFVEARIFCCAC